MGNQEYSIIELGTKNILSFKAYLQKEKLEWIRKENIGALGLVLDGNKACGALMYSFYPNEDTAYVESICVDKTLRNQGLGEMLYEAFEDKVYELGIIEAGARVVLPLESDYEGFLEAMGFNQSEPGERYYEFTASQLKSWLKDPKVEHIRKKCNKTGDEISVPASKFSAKVKAQFADIPYKPKLSFGLKGSAEKVYSLADSDEEGNILIQEIKLGETITSECLLFLQFVIAYYLKELTGEGKLYITVTTNKQAELLKTIALMDNPSYVACLNMAKTIGEDIPVRFEMNYGAFVIPRINGISKMLSDFGEGYEHFVTYLEEDSVINLFRDEGKRQISLHYEVEDTNNAEDYVLSMITCIDKDELTEEEKELIPKWKENSALCSFTEEPGGRIYARAAVIENDGLVDPNFFKAVLDGFMTEVDSLQGIDRVLQVK